MNSENIMPSETSQTQKKVLYDSTYMQYLEQTNSQTESRIEVTRGCVFVCVCVWGGENANYCLMATEFLFGMMQILEIDSGDVYKTL